MVPDSVSTSFRRNMAPTDCQSGLNGNINIPLESPSKPLPASL